MIEPARILPFLLISFVLAASARAATLTGRVVDPDGRPVPGATIIVGGDGSALRTQVTNQLGEFSIETPNGARVEIRVAVPGFRSEIIRLDGDDDRDLGAIRLSLSAISDSVVVSASQVEIPLSEASSTVTVISGAELQARQLRTVVDALRSVPGLSIAAAGGPGAVTGLFPRGGESNFTLVFVDDVPVNAFGGEYDFAHLSTENVERIEVVRGPQSAVFGSNAIGGVVRIVTKRGGPPSVSGTVEAGRYDTFRLAAATSGSVGRFEWGASTDGLKSDGRNGRQTDSGLTVENNDYGRASGALSLGWRTGGATFRGQIRREHDERGIPGPFGSNPIGTYTAIDTVSRGDNEQTTGSFSVTIPLARRVRSLFQAGYHRLDSTFLGPDFIDPLATFESQSNSRRWNGRAQVDVGLPRQFELTAGVEVQRERAGSTFIVDDSFEESPVERTIAGYFAEARWNAQRRLLVTAGVRLDDIDGADVGTGSSADTDDGILSVNPRIAVAWLIRPGAEQMTRVRAAAATGIRPPGAFDIAFTDNPSLKPERSVSGEIGIEQAFLSGRARAEAVAFFNRYDDLIVAVGSFERASRYTTDNIANARARGIELGLAAAHRVSSRRPLDIQARIAYTFLESDVLAVDQEREAPPPFAVGDPLLRRPRHQVSLDVTAATGFLSGFIAARSRSRTLDVEPSLGTFGGLHPATGFQVWDAGLSWRLAASTSIFGRVENLFDRSYEEALGFPALGRRATVGLRLAAGF